MAKNTFKLWVNPETNTIYDTWGSNVSAPPLVFLQGDAVEIEVHLIRWTQGATRFMQEIEFPAGSTLRLAIGKLDTAPTSGTYTITYGGNTTTALAYNADAATISTALNALASITSAGGVTVTKLTNSIIQITFNAVGHNTGFTVDGLALSPPVAIKTITLQAGSASVKGAYLIKVKQAPVVYQDTWDDLDEPTLTVTTLQANRAKRVSISPDPKEGSWALTGTEAIAPKISKDGGDITNLPTYWNEDVTKRVSVLANATDFSEFQYAVTKVGPFAWDFAVINDYDIPVGYTMPFTANAVGINGYVGKTAIVDFNTAEVEYLLGGSSSASTYFELELTDASGVKQTILQTTCTIKNDMIDSTSFTPISLGNGMSEAPIDGLLYARKDGVWETFTPEDNQGILDAPSNGNSYLRKDGAWVTDVDGGTY